jgi:hypothetical protein
MIARADFLIGTVAEAAPTIVEHVVRGHVSAHDTKKRRIWRAEHCLHIRIGKVTKDVGDVDLGSSVAFEMRERGMVSSRRPKITASHIVRR